MIGKISVPRGEHVAPLIWYLYGPGRREEHTDPHLVAGWRHPAELEPPLRPDGKRDFRRLTGLLKQPQALLGDRGYARPVWHSALRAAPEDRMLSDEEWAPIAADVMDRTGLSPYGQEDEAVRWVAVRHGDDHIHLVAMLARQDGGPPACPSTDTGSGTPAWPPSSRYGLRPTAPADRTAPRRPSRAETRRPPAAAWTRHRASPCGGTSPPRPPARASEPSSSPAWSGPGSWSGSGSAPGPRSGDRVRRRPARRHRQGRRAGLVRRRETRRRPDLAQAPPAVDPARVPHPAAGR